MGVLSNFLLFSFMGVSAFYQCFPPWQWVFPLPSLLFCYFGDIFGRTVQDVGRALASGIAMLFIFVYCVFV